MNKNLIVILVLSAVVYSANTWKTSVYVLDEARNAGCAMEMYQRNDWVVPTFNGELRTDKPPLHYYLMQLSYRVFGINAFSARLYATVMGLLTVWVVYFFGRKLAGEQTSFFSALILISSLQLAVQFHLAVPDPCLIFFLTLGYLSFIYAYLLQKSRFYYLFYVAISLATLSKGPVAILFTGLTVLIFLVAQQNFKVKTLLQIKVPQGILIFLVLVLPWYILVGIATEGEWIEQFFFKHNINRFTSTMEGHGGFPLASFVIVIGALVPFSFFFPQAIRNIWHEQKTNPFIQFCLIATGVVVIFFAFSRTILPNYPEPALPFFALLLGFYLSTIYARPEIIKKQRLHVNAIVYVIVSMAIPFAVWIGLGYEEPLRDLRYSAGYFSILSLGAFLGLYFMIRKEIAYVVYAYTTSSVLLLLIFFYVIYPRIDQQNPVLQSLPLMVHPEKPVLYYRDFNPAFVFALRHPINAIGTAREAEAYSGSAAGFYLITQKRFLSELESLDARVIFEGKDLFESRTTLILEK
ncbi:MAG: glycosyltransferase family 39 protein [Cyclobacteriaceae bacterium]|nr:glycosyltransferase family 39 protein [Cyclobacteriaceae bacterium]